jgi:hypothetical protein
MTSELLAYDTDKQSRDQIVKYDSTLEDKRDLCTRQSLQKGCVIDGIKIFTDAKLQPLESWSTAHSQKHHAIPNAPRFVVIRVQHYH